MDFFSLSLLTGFQAGMLIPFPTLSQDPVLCFSCNLITCQEYGNIYLESVILLGTRISRSAFQRKLLCASHFLMLALNVNSKQLQTSFCWMLLSLSFTFFSLIRTYVQWNLKNFYECLVFGRMLPITQILWVKSLPHSWGGGINGEVLGSDSNSATY